MRIRHLLPAALAAVALSLSPSTAYADDLLLAKDSCYIDGSPFLANSGLFIKFRSDDDWEGRKCVSSVTDLVSNFDGALGEPKDGRVSPRELAYSIAVLARPNIAETMRPDYVGRGNGSGMRGLLQRTSQQLLTQSLIHFPTLDINGDGYIDSRDDLNGDDTITIEDRALQRK